MYGLTEAAIIGHRKGIEMRAKSAEKERKRREQNKENRHGEDGESTCSSPVRSSPMRMTRFEGTSNSGESCACIPWRAP